MQCVFLFCYLIFALWWETDLINNSVHLFCKCLGSMIKNIFLKGMEVKELGGLLDIDGLIK